MDDTDDFDPVPASKGKKKLSVERIYQKKTQLEHILLRPDTYIGSVEPLTQVNSSRYDYAKIITHSFSKCGSTTAKMMEWCCVTLRMSLACIKSLTKLLLTPLIISSETKTWTVYELISIRKLKYEEPNKKSLLISSYDFAEKTTKLLFTTTDVVFRLSNTKTRKSLFQLLSSVIC